MENTNSQQPLHYNILISINSLILLTFAKSVQTGPGANPASCTMGTGSFPGVKSGRGVTLTPHPLLVLWSRKSRAIPLLPLQAVRPVQSLSACTRVHFTFTLQASTEVTDVHITEHCTNLFVSHICTHSSHVCISSNYVCWLVPVLWLTIM